MTATSPIRLNTMGEAMAQLPKRTAVEYRRGQVIYMGAQPSNLVYFLFQGRVAVSVFGAKGNPVGVTIYRTNEFFGEAALINQISRFEQAVALEDSLLLSWPATEIVEAIVRHPHLGMAMATDLVEREADLRWRIESFRTDRIRQRVAHTLIRFSDRLGTPEANGWVRMIPLTHKLISRYIGSTREIVGHHMTEFRKMGFVSYSRTGILVNQPALQKWLDEEIHRAGRSSVATP